MTKKPFVTKEQLEEIAKIYPTPFHIYDERGIRENVRALKEAFSWNKGYKEYFAVKATPNPFLIQILREYGCGCDCSSYTELMMSEAIGAVGRRYYVFFHATPAEELSMRISWEELSIWMILPILIFWRRQSDISRRPSAAGTIRWAVSNQQ